jgi:TonB family protein
VALVFEGGFDGFGHVVLATAMLEGKGGAGENAAGREEVVEVRQILRGGGRDRDGGRGGHDDRSHHSAYTLAMIRLPVVCLVLLISAYVSANAQQASSSIPAKMVIARHTFFDFGPPFDFYELITVNSTSNGLSVERAIVTLAGDACAQPPSVEVKAAIIPSTMRDLLKGKNPCDIPDKDLQKEAKRCKHCLVFSGADVTMQVSCGTKERSIRMNVLDKDMFGQAPNTPEHTSWTMAVMSSLDAALGPGVLDKPMFALNDSKQPSENITELDISQDLRSGKFDDLFKTEKPLSELALEAEKQPHLPTVKLAESSPAIPITMELPRYPPIARAEHAEGEVSITFDVTADGQTKNLSFGDSGKLFHSTTAAVVEKWTFPKTAEGYKEHITLSFKLNCGVPATPR